MENDTGLLKSKLEEEKRKSSEQARKIKNLEAQISYLKGRLDALRASKTYRVGLIFSEARRPVDFLKIPYKLFVFTLSHLKESRGKRQRPLVSSDSKVQASSGLSSGPDKADHERVWCASEPLYGKTVGGFKVALEHESGQYKSRRFEVSGGSSYTFETDVLHGLQDKGEYDFEITVEELDRSGSLVSTRVLTGPVHVVFEEGASSESGVSGRRLCFHIVAREESAFLSVCIQSFSGFDHREFRCLYGTCEEFGVSVIVPSYKGRGRISRLLTSLCGQTESYKNFEILVIENGGADGVEELVNDFSEAHHGLRVRYFYLEKASAPAARNLGIIEAHKEYITFIDDDDWVSESFIESMLASVTGKKKHTVGLSNVIDYESGELVESVITKQVRNAEKNKKIRYSDISSLLTMNACKIMPSFYVKQLKYDQDMKSGEDVCYFTRYFMRFSPSLSLEPSLEGAIYYREVNFGSVSRQGGSYDFNVKQRLQVISSIDREAKIFPRKDRVEFAASKISAQSAFIFSYLKNNLQDYPRYIDDIGSEDYYSYPLHENLASKLSDTLVYSYCFLPYADTAAVVMAKRIQASGKPVDVIYNSMGAVRSVDVSLEKITKGYVGRRKEINSPAAFSSWSSIEQYATKALSAAESMISSRGKEYSEIYSRVMWPGSHFAAALHKVKSPSVKWVAEFSDPLLKDVHGQARDVKIDPSWLGKEGIFDALSKRVDNTPDTRNMFYWCEYLPYVLADEVVFTNKNQLDYMMSYLEDESLRAEVYKKCKISHHPTLPKEFYKAVVPEYQLDKDCVNFAYFGNFYATRGVDDLLRAVGDLSYELKIKFKLHIFTNNSNLIEQDVARYGIADSVRVNNYIGFLEFLALSNKMNVLIVNDAITVGIKDINPYLPSKYSDYLGSSARIWGVCEKGSVLESELKEKQRQRSYISYVGDYDSISSSLKSAIVDAGGAMRKSLYKV